MSDIDQALTYLRALLTRDFAKADVLFAEMGSLPADQYALVVGATFLNAVGTRFSSDTDVREITRFVQGVKNRFENGEAIDPRLAEAAIRAATGESALLENVDGDQLIHIQLTLTYVLLSGWPSEKLDEFFADTKELLSE